MSCQPMNNYRGFEDKKKLSKRTQHSIAGFYNLAQWLLYHQFNVQQFYVLPTQRIYVFCVDLRKNSNYFPIHH